LLRNEFGSSEQEFKVSTYLEMVNSLVSDLSGRIERTVLSFCITQIPVTAYKKYRTSMLYPADMQDLQTVKKNGCKGKQHHQNAENSASM